MAARIVAISGKSGCGNSTVSRLLADRLGVKLINYTFRRMAEDKGVSFEEMLRLANEEPDYSYDRALDAKQVELAHEGDCVIGSRLAMWLLPDADLRVFLAGSLEVRAPHSRTRRGQAFGQARLYSGTRRERPSALFDHLRNRQ